MKKKKYYIILLGILILAGVGYYVQSSELFLNPYQKDAAFISSNLLKYYTFSDSNTEEYYKDN